MGHVQTEDGSPVEKTPGLSLSTEKKKKSTTYKLKITFYLADSLKTLNPGDRTPRSLRDASEEASEEPRCVGGFITKTR